MALLIGMLLMLLAQILTFYQLQGQLKYQWFKDNYWVIVLMGIPISMMYMESVRQIITHYGGLLWPSRLIGFGIGVVVFAILSQLLFGESLTTKTMVCLILSGVIILIQIFWK
jgi:multidrug transporter EmrE-like cation transporter